MKGRETNLRVKRKGKKGNFGEGAGGEKEIEARVGELAIILGGNRMRIGVSTEDNPEEEESRTKNKWPPSENPSEKTSSKWFLSVKHKNPSAAM